MVAMTTSDLPLERIARGKVRDVYAVDADRLLLVATDRVSAYDVVMAEANNHYEQREAEMGEAVMREVERQVMLRIIDQRCRACRFPFCCSK